MSCSGSGGARGKPFGGDHRLAKRQGRSKRGESLELKIMSIEGKGPVPARLENNHRAYTLLQINEVRHLFAEQKASEASRFLPRRRPGEHLPSSRLSRRGGADHPPRPPNGKRYARRGHGGEIENAFGFDLTPLVARAGEIENLAEEVRAENKAVRLLRERITLLRRDIVKMIATGLEEAVPGDWEALHLRYVNLSGRFVRNLLRTDLEALTRDLAALNAEIQNALENHVKRQKRSANESHSERHIQNQITETIDLEPSLREGRGQALRSNDQGSPPPSAAANANPSAPRTYPLGMVLDACPDIVDYARSGINNWRDLATTAALVRSALGVSPDAWSQALEAMGEHDASIVIAAILQRGEEIKSAGGYLRVLTAKARAGEFSLGPVLMALLRGKAAKLARERKRAG
jgi:replication initiation protein RepC